MKAMEDRPSAVADVRAQEGGKISSQKGLSDQPSLSQEESHLPLHATPSPWEEAQSPGSFSSQSKASQLISGGSQNASREPGSLHPGTLGSDAGLLSRFVPMPAILYASTQPCLKQSLFVYLPFALIRMTEHVSLQSQLVNCSILSGG